MKGLYTIGYERAGWDDFVRILKSCRIDLLLDVLEVPISRRKGFSKSALRSALDAAGIGYRHERSLGSPKPIRDRVQEDGDHTRFFMEFERHLATQATLLETLAQELNGNVVLMCYERDPGICHRRPVAEALAGLTGATPVHLILERPENAAGTGQLPLI